MAYIFLKLTVYVSEPACDHSGLCYPLHEYSASIMWPPLIGAFRYSESTTNIILGLCPHFIHWHLWIFLHSQCFNHKQMFWESHLWSLSFLHDVHPPTGWRGLFLLDGSVCVLSPVCLEISQASILTLKALGWLNRMQYQEFLSHDEMQMRSILFTY